MRINIQLILALFICVTASCRNRDHFDESVETLNKGEITIHVDEVYGSLAGELVKSYVNVYPEAKINLIFMPEKNVIEMLMNGTSRMAITGKELSEAELQQIKTANEMEPRISRIAREAIAVITSINSTDTVFDFDAFLTSRNNPPASDFVNTKYVFMKGQSSFVNAVTKGSTLNFSDMFSLGSSDSLIQYISSTGGSYGFISFALLSDGDDPKVREILSKVKILPLAMKGPDGVKTVYELSQSSIAANEYPLQRNIYVIRGNMAQSLGTGFVNFMYRSKASRLFLKAGLIPEVMPERQILIKE